MTAWTIFLLRVPPELSDLKIDRILRANSVPEIRAVWSERAGLLADQYDLLVRWQYVPGLRDLDAADFSIKDTFHLKWGFQVLVPVKRGTTLGATS